MRAETVILTAVSSVSASLAFMRHDATGSPAWLLTGILMTLLALYHFVYAPTRGES